MARLSTRVSAALGMKVEDYYTEGQLTRMKARIVSRPVLAEAATRLEIGSLIGMAGSELAAGGPASPGTLADAFEARLLVRGDVQVEPEGGPAIRAGRSSGGRTSAQSAWRRRWPPVWPPACRSNPLTSASHKEIASALKVSGE